MATPFRPRHAPLISLFLMTAASSAAAHGLYPHHHHGFARSDDACGVIGGGVILGTIAICYIVTGIEAVWHWLQKMGRLIVGRSRKDVEEEARPLREHRHADEPERNAKRDGD